MSVSSHSVCFLEKYFIIITIYLKLSYTAGFLQHINLIAISPEICISLIFYPETLLFLLRSPCLLCTCLVLGYGIFIICEVGGVSPFNLESSTLYILHDTQEKV